jgi:hypothetical protein
MSVEITSVSRGTLARLMSDAITVQKGHVVGDDARTTLRAWGIDVEPPAPPLLCIV